MVTRRVVADHQNNKMNQSTGKHVYTESWKGVTFEGRDDTVEINMKTITKDII